MARRRRCRIKPVKRSDTNDPIRRLEREIWAWIDQERAEQLLAAQRAAEDEEEAVQMLLLL